MNKATQKDIPELIRILADPFSDNLSVNQCVKQDRNRLKRIENQLRYICKISLRNELAFINNQKSSAILCNFSKGKKANLFDEIYYILKVSGLKLAFKLLKREQLLKAILPKINYCHLWFIGVEKDKQGQGLGSESIEFLKNYCQEINLPIYLETSNPENIKFYEKNGFTLYHKEQLSTDSFVLYFFLWNPY